MHIMQKFVVKTVAIALASLSFSTAAQSADYISGSVGWVDAIDQENESVQGGVEYRFSPIGYHLRPMVGANVNTDSSVYGYAGLNMDVPILSNQLYLIPNFAVGAYSEGDGKDLGGALEFRSGIEIAYQMENAHRIGLALNHISNAGIYNKNPGVENVVLTYSVPTGAVFGN
ncbi:MAG: acyloxyacyl hydrolase [Alphaproteobacteria bacterium]|nr:acyloxyacyl hydrolase [Alphaproteobacteria bacterium]